MTELPPHYTPKIISDRAAYALVKFFRVFADLFFQKRRIQRLEISTITSARTRAPAARS